MSEWQDISTAPKDGTEFLAYDSHCGKMDVCHAVNINRSGMEPHWVIWAVQSDSEYGPDTDEFGGGADQKSITHWQPLPTPPTLGGK